jgi:hypothetical protein
MLREYDKLNAEKRLKALQAELDAIYTNMTALNMEQRVRRRSELLIAIQNLKKWLSDYKAPAGEANRMDYGITPLVKLIV